MGILFQSQFFLKFNKKSFPGTLKTKSKTLNILYSLSKYQKKCCYYMLQLLETQILTNFNCVSNNLNQIMKSKSLMKQDSMTCYSLEIDSCQWRIQNKKNTAETSNKLEVVSNIQVSFNIAIPI